MSTPSPLPCPSLLFQWAAVIIINILLLLFRIFAPPSPSPLQPRNALWKNSRKAGHGKNTVFIFPLYEFLECMILLFSLGNCCDDAIFRPGYQTTSCFPLSPLPQSPKPPVSQKLRTRDRRFASPTFFHSPIVKLAKVQDGERRQKTALCRDAKVRRRRTEGARISICSR